MKNFYLLPLLCLPLLLRAQQEVGLHFMRKVWQSTYTNPAFFSDNTVDIALGSLYGNYSNSTFTTKNVITRNGDGTSSIDLQSVLSQSKASNYLALNGQVEPISIGFRIKNLQFGLTSGVRSFAYLGYNNNLLGLLANGNGAYIDQTVNVAPVIQANVYTEYGLSAAYRFLDGKISLGGRVKYLTGLANLSTSADRREVSLYTDPEFYQLRFTTDYEIRSSNLFTDSLQFDPSRLGFATNNTGLGYDIGIQIKPIENLSLAASVIDIGSINWRDNAKVSRSNGTYVYDGIHFDDFTADGNVNFDRISDTLRKTFEFKDAETQAYKTALPTRFYVSGSYRFAKMFRLGAVFYGEKLDQRFNPAMAISGNLEVRKWLTMGLLVGYRNQRIGNIGFNLSTKAGPFQWFMATDNVGAMILPGSTRNFNIRTGFNILILGKNRE